MKPMMSDKEIDLIEEVILQLAEQKGLISCLEWGSGGSTIYFPKHNPDIGSWLSVEHDGNWVKKLVPESKSNTTIIWSPENEQWYVDCVKHSGLFDFILVDGLHRDRCLEFAKGMLKEGGSILLHDAGRADLYPLIEKYGGKLLIDGEEPLNGRFKHRGLAVFR